MTPEGGWHLITQLSFGNGRVQLASQAKQSEWSEQIEVEFLPTGPAVPGWRERLAVRYIVYVSKEIYNTHWHFDTADKRRSGYFDDGVNCGLLSSDIINTYQVNQ